MKAIYFFIFLIQGYDLFTYNELQVSKVLQHIAKRTPIVASGGDFRGLGTILRGKNMSNSFLSGASFAKNEKDVIYTAGTIKISNQGSDLTGTNFSNSELKGINFRGAILERAVFDGADVEMTDFSETNLKNASFKGTKNMDKAIFCKAILPDGTVLTSENMTKGSFNAYCKK